MMSVSNSGYNLNALYRAVSETLRTNDDGILHTSGPLVRQLLQGMFPALRIALPLDAHKWQLKSSTVLSRANFPQILAKSRCPNHGPFLKDAALTKEYGFCFLGRIVLHNYRASG